MLLKEKLRFSSVHFTKSRERRHVLGEPLYALLSLMWEDLHWLQLGLSELPNHEPAEVVSFSRWRGYTWTQILMWSVAFSSLEKWTLNTNESPKVPSYWGKCQVFNPLVCCTSGDLIFFSYRRQSDRIMKTLHISAELFHFYSFIPSGHGIISVEWRECRHQVLLLALLVFDL
jgi:hypothetical protein